MFKKGSHMYWITCRAATMPREFWYRYQCLHRQAPTDSARRSLPLSCDNMNNKINEIGMRPTDALRTSCGIAVIYSILKYLLLFQSNRMSHFWKQNSGQISTIMRAKR